MYYAYLVDRIHMHEGREQVYGTQTYKIKEEDGRSFFFIVPIENIEHVDEQRAAMGMGPLTPIPLLAGSPFSVFSPEP